MAANSTDTDNIIAYKPGKFLVISYGGVVKGNFDASAGWKYILGDQMIQALLGFNNNIRVAQDLYNGQKIVAFGIDGDCTTDTGTTALLLDTISGPNKPLEIGLVASAVTDELAAWYRSLKDRYGDVRLVSHTFYHFHKRFEVTDETWTIPPSQIIYLKQPFRPLIAYIKTVDDTQTFSLANGDVNTGKPTAVEYCVNASIYDNTQLDGFIKFSAADVGKRIKITYSCDYEANEYLGSLEALRSKSCLTYPVLYTTAGISVSQATFEAAAKDNIIICDYLLSPDNFRMRSMTEGELNKMVLPMGMTFSADEFSGDNCDDISMMVHHTKSEAEAIYPKAIDRANSMELPIVFYWHDMAMSPTYFTSAWNDTKYNKDWKKDTIQETQDYIKDFYVFMNTQLNATNPYWMTRSEYVRRYQYMNKYLDYYVDNEGSKVLITIQNTGQNPVKGLTLRVPTSAQPLKVGLLNGNSMPFFYASGITTTWFDLPAGTTATVEVNL